MRKCKYYSNVIGEEGSGLLTLENRYVKIILCKETKGGLSSFVDIQSKRNFIFSKPYPLYRLTLSKLGEDQVELTSLDTESFEIERSTSPKGEILTLIYGHHRSVDVCITCSVLLEPDSALSKWRISVKNNTTYGVRAIQYPIVITPSILGESDEDNYFMSGNSSLISRPGRGVRKRERQAQFKSESLGGEQSARYNWYPLHYPGTIGVQLQAYYDKTAGLYMATHDDKGCVKSFGYTGADDEGALDMSITHHYDERPGLSFDLPYETILGVFQGDWYTAADIYKEWAYKQHWCSRKIYERTDIPAWAKEPRPNLVIICRGNVERARGTLNSPPAEWPITKFWPAKKVVPIIRKYSFVLGTPVVTWYEGFEKIGSPGGPVDIFPPYEGEKSFKSAMKELCRDGNYPLLYITGFHWCYKRAMTGYDGRELFKKEGLKSAVLDEDGNIVRCVFMNAQKEFVNLCVGDRDIKGLLMKNLLHLLDLGGVAVQIDQQLGMYAQVCYSDRHGHAPGYGPWMYENVCKFLQNIRREIKKRNAETTFSYETACETWIQETDLHLHREYRGGIPLFTYIYHEYALSFGGDAMTSFCHPEVSMIKHALICTQGVQNIVSIGEPEYDIDAEEIEHPVILLLKNIFNAQRTYAREYLVFGQMLRPTELQVSKIVVDRYLPVNADVNNMGTTDVPSVFHSVWKSRAGKIGYVLANWTGVQEKVTLTLLKTDGAAFIVTGMERKAVAEDELKTGKITTVIPPRSVMMIEQE